MAITAAKLMVQVGAETSEAESKLKGVSGQINGFSQKAMDVGKKLTTFVTLPLVGIGVAATKMAADFDTNLSLLQAASGATDEQMEKLRQTAFALGKDMTLPGTSAADAAEAMLELSKAGLSVEDSLAAARGVLQMSAAGQLSNAQAAEIAANALNAFHLEGDQATKVADLLAAAANASSGEVTDMADALKMSAAVAYSSGFSIDELVASISEMANAGIQGSDAGTSLKQMILSLQAPTGKAAQLMNELGISVYDSQGNMLPMVDIIGQFSGVLGGLTEKQRNAALATIFGSDAVRAANIVLMGGVDAYNNMSQAVNEQGAAAKMAGAQMQGLRGAFENIKNAADTAMLAGIQPFKKDIEDLAKKIANAVDSFNGMDEAQQKNIVYLGLFAAGIGPATWALGALSKMTTFWLGILSKVPGILTGVNTALKAWQSGMTLTTALGAAGLSPLVLTLGAIALAVGAIVGVWIAWNQNIEKTNQEGAKAVKGQWEDFFQKQVESGKSAAEVLQEYQKAQANAKAALEGTNPILRLFIRDQEQLTGGFSQLGGALVQTAGNYEEYKKGLEAVAAAQGLVIDSNGNLTRAYAGSMSVQAEVIQSSYLLTEAEFKERQNRERLKAGMAALRGETAAEADGANQAAAATDLLKGSIGNVNPVTMEAKGILGMLDQALSDVGWDAQAARAASQALSIGLGETSTAAVQLENDVRLVTQAFAEHVIGADELNGFMQQAKDGTLELSAAQREQYQAAVDQAKSLREGAKAAQEAAVAQLDLAQSLKDATAAQIAQAMIGSLKEALQSGTLDLPDFVTAVSSIQDAFGLTDEKSRTLAEGIGILTQALASGKLPAEEMGTALQNLITDAKDGSVNWETFLGQYSTTTETMATNVMQSLGKVEFVTLAQNAETGAQNVSAAFLGQNWGEVGTGITDGIAEGIKTGSGKIQAAAKKAAQDALKAAQEELDIKSPSRKMAEAVGLPMMQGWAKGILANADLPARALGASSAAVMGAATNYYQDVSVQATLNRELDIYVLARQVADEIRRSRL
jgi:TP901 family phage tail tape measure protein